MDTYTIDIELEHYYGDRLATSNREACRRLYLRAVSRFHGSDLHAYLGQVRSHAKAYASLNHMLRSPFRHIEAPLLLSSLILVLAGIIMVTFGQATVLVAGGTAAGLVGMIQCSQKLAMYRRRYAIREAVFLELVETLQQEMNETA